MKYGEKFKNMENLKGTPWFSVVDDGFPQFETERQDVVFVIGKHKHYLMPTILYFHRKTANPAKQWFDPIKREWVENSYVTHYHYLPKFPDERDVFERLTERMLDRGLWPQDAKNKEQEEGWQQELFDYLNSELGCIPLHSQCCEIRDIILNHNHE